MDSSITVAVIGGVFTLAGTWLTNYLQNRPKTMQPAQPPPPVATGMPAQAQALPRGSSLRIGAVIRDVGIIMILTALAGVVLGIGMSNASEEELLGAAALANIVFGTVGFVISGARVPSGRWKHLFAVAIGLWLAGILNVVLGIVDGGSWFISVFLILLMMAIGGGISYLFNRGQRAVS